VIVCGWYTPDYAERARRFMAGLDRVGARHDIVAVQPSSSRWEHNTLAKARHILKAMDRHPSESILFSDVDIEVRKPLDGFGHLEGDIAVHQRTKMLHSGWPRWMARTTALLIKPHPICRQFMQAWASESARAAYGANDQRTFPLAVGRTPGIVLANLPLSFCAMEHEHEDPILLHVNASKEGPKMHKLTRWLYARAAIAVGERQ
jgi:hypothetical protein